MYHMLLKLFLVDDNEPFYHADIIKWKHFPRYWTFDVFFYLRLNKRFSKQSRPWWFEMPSSSLSRHCNDHRKKHCGKNRIDHGRPCRTEFTLMKLYSTKIPRYHSRFLKYKLMRVNSVPRSRSWWILYTLHSWYHGCWHWLTSIPAWISHYGYYAVWDVINYPFPNVNGATIEVWEWKVNLTPHFTGHVITYPCWN